MAGVRIVRLLGALPFSKTIIGKAVIINSVTDC